jgi:hypothetical protein
MIDWWNNLEPLAKFFWCVALAGTLLQIFLFAASFIGGDFDGDVDGDLDFDIDGDVDGDMDLDSHHGGDAPGHHDVTHGVKILSFRALVAFTVGFGWAGALGLLDGWSVLAATAAAIATGVIFIFIIYVIMRVLVSLQDPGGGLDYKNAINQEGRVYFTVPGSRSGEGQIEIMLQGRLITANAVTEHPDPIPPRAPVIVLAIEGKTLMVVEPATVRDHLMTH